MSSSNDTEMTFRLRDYITALQRKKKKKKHSEVMVCFASEKYESIGMSAFYPATYPTQVTFMQDTCKAMELLNITSSDDRAAGML